jgi:hypothetical protein
LIDAAVHSAYVNGVVEIARQLTINRDDRQIAQVCTHGDFIGTD